MAYIPELTTFEETLASNYDLSTGTGTFTSSDISDYNSFSMQFVCTGFAGSAEVILEQSLDNSNWDELKNGTISLTPSNCDFTLQQRNWMSKYLRVRFITSQQGTMSIYLLAKR